MSTTDDRQSRYHEIRQRFVEDPEFRKEVRADPTSALGKVLGELTDEEKQWIAQIVDSQISEEDLIDELNRSRVKAW